MSAQPAKNANVQGIDALLVKSDQPQINSLWRLAGPKILANFGEDYLPYITKTERSFGGTSIFEIPYQLGQLNGIVMLEFDIYTGDGVGGAVPYTGTSAMWDDYLTVSVVENMRLKYGSLEPQSIPGDEIKLIYVDQKLSDEQKAAYKNDLKGPLPPAERTAMLQAATGSTIHCVLRCPFFFASGNPHKALPMTLGSSLYIEVKWRPLTDVRWSTGDGDFNYSVLPSISAQNCTAEVVYTETPEAAMLQQMSNTGISFLAKYGIQSTIGSNVVLPTGTTTVEFKLTDHNAPIQQMLIYTRETKNLQPNSFKRWELRGWDGDDLRLDQVELPMSGGMVRSKVSQTINRYANDKARVLSLKSQLFGRAWAIDFGLHACGEDDPSGSIDYGGIVNGTIRCTFINNTGAPMTVQVDSLSFNHSFIKLIGGQLYKLFM